MKDISLKNISELKNNNFLIPTYQRGYRWTEQQVIDLLNDINEFMERNPEENEIYCLQPLVVKDRGGSSWEVIDGQQRLTTIKILLACLKEQTSYSIEYETRNWSKNFLNDICNKNEDDANNIDFYHMWQAKETIDTWFDNKNIDHPRFLEVLPQKVKFIWYESPENINPISVFTRLNIGKIPLTDAELIKALFLNQSNFSDVDNSAGIRLYQQEIAAEWDNIEYSLQNDEFWLFIHTLEWNKPTRIDFIFDLMQEKNVLGLSDDLYGKIGCDEHKSFRYFYEYFKLYKTEIKKNDGGYRLRDDIWQKVKEYFQIFQEWYNDLELYHYIGYLVWLRIPLQNLLDAWNNANDIESFKRGLKKQIKECLNKCSDLTRSYGENGEKKTECFPLLLLFNIQTVIDQNKELVNSDKYGLGTFYKFPFHLFKIEGKKANGKGWEIEHIASNAGDDLTKLESQKIYLASIKYSLNLQGDFPKEIETFIKEGKTDDFRKLCDEVHTLSEVHKFIASIPDKRKNYIWNFALLDSTTNEEFQNAPFPVKRICVLAKDRGCKATLELDEKTGALKIDYSPGITFVAPCTRNVFTKAYTNIPIALNAWTLDDAENYLRKMNKTLSDAGFIDDQSDDIDDFINNEVDNG